MAALQTSSAFPQAESAPVRPTHWAKAGTHFFWYVETYEVYCLGVISFL
jgi:hypothetical protein